MTKDLKEIKVIKVNLVTRVRLGNKDHKVIKDPKEIKAK